MNGKREVADILVGPTAEAGVLDVQDSEEKSALMHVIEGELDTMCGTAQQIIDLGINPALINKDKRARMGEGAWKLKKGRRQRQKESELETGVDTERAAGVEAERGTDESKDLEQIMANISDWQKTTDRHNKSAAKKSWQDTNTDKSWPKAQGHASTTEGAVVRLTGGEQQARPLMVVYCPETGRMNREQAARRAPGDGNRMQREKRWYLYNRGDWAGARAVGGQWQMRNGPGE